MEQKQKIKFSQEYEYSEWTQEYLLNNSNQTNYSVIDENNINQHINDFFFNYNNNINIEKFNNNLTFGMKYFQSEGHHKMLNEISQKYKQSLNLDKFKIYAQSMNLQIHNAYIIIDFIKIANHDSLKKLTLELQNNHLSIEGISNIMIDISEQFKSLEKVKLLFGSNKGDSDKQYNKGLISLLQMNNIVEIKIQFNQISGINSLFYPLVDYSIMNHTLNKIDINLLNNYINLDLLSYIFKICINLKSIKLNLNNSKISNDIKFFTELTNSTSKIESLEMDLSRATYSFKINEILDILFISEYLKQIKINFVSFKYSTDDRKQMFKYLQNAKRLEYLKLNISNNSIGVEEIKCFSEQIKSDSLRIFQLDIRNTFEIEDKIIDNIYCLESAILSLPLIQSAKISFPSNNNTEKYSQHLISYSNQIESLIYSYIAYAKQIQPFMIFNPQHIFSDLYF